MPWEIYSSSKTLHTTPHQNDDRIHPNTIPKSLSVSIENDR